MSDEPFVESRWTMLRLVDRGEGRTTKTTTRAARPGQAAVMSLGGGAAA